MYYNKTLRLISAGIANKPSKEHKTAISSEPRISINWKTYGYSLAASAHFGNLQVCR